MYNISLSLYLWSFIFIFNTSIIDSKFVKAISTISLCNDSIAEWKYCINRIPKNRNWYQAAAECRSYGGELVALESKKKIDDLANQLKTLGTNLSTGLFVNANRPFYSGNDNFAWSSGIEFQISDISNNIEDCVTYSLSNLKRVACDKNLSVFLVCQRPSQRIVRNYTSEQFLVSFSKKNFNYSHESCDYFTFAKFDYNWYQAKKLCETFNSELLGIPSWRECQLIEEGQNLALQSDDKKIHPKVIFLNMHLHMYASNISTSLFRDASGKVMNESLCGWKINLKYSDNEYCISFKEGTLSPFKCGGKDRSDLIGFICKQCHPNKVDYRTRSMASNPDATPSINKARLSTSQYALYTGFICSCLSNITLIICLVLLCSYIQNIRRNINSGESTRVDAIELTKYAQPVQRLAESSVYDYVSQDITSTRLENSENTQQLEIFFLESSTYDYVSET